MSDRRRIHNTGPTELVYDTAGHILPGSTSVMGALSDPVTARLVKSGAIIVPSEPEKAVEYVEHLEPTPDTEADEPEKKSRKRKSGEK